MEYLASTANEPLRVVTGSEAKLAVGFVNYVLNLIPSTRWKLVHGGSTANQRASGVWTLRAVKVVAYFASCLRNFLLVASRRWCVHGCHG